MTATEPIAVLEQAGYPDLAALCKTLRFGTRAAALLRDWRDISDTSAPGNDWWARRDALLKEIDDGV